MSIRENKPAAGVPKTELYEYEKKASLYLSKDSEVIIAKRLNDAALAAKLVDTGFWEFIVTAFSEQHEDATNIRNMLGDNYLAYATGARPVSLSISGFLLTTKDQDHRIDFIELYHRVFRGTMLRPRNYTEEKIKLYMTIKDTTVAIWPLAISFANTSQLSDFTQFSMSAIGYEYRVLRDINKAYI